MIGTPVDFVHVAKSKEVLRNTDIPSISNIGTRGGTPIAVACINELISILNEKYRLDLNLYTLIQIERYREYYQ